MLTRRLFTLAVPSLILTPGLVMPVKLLPVTQCFEYHIKCRDLLTGKTFVERYCFEQGNLGAFIGYSTDHKRGSEIIRDYRMMISKLRANWSVITGISVQTDVS